MGTSEHSIEHPAFINAGNFLTSWENITFSPKNIFHEVTGKSHKYTACLPYGMHCTEVAMLRRGACTGHLPESTACMLISRTQRV